MGLYSVEQKFLSIEQFLKNFKQEFSKEISLESLMTLYIQYKIKIYLKVKTFEDIIEIGSGKIKKDEIGLGYLYENISIERSSVRVSYYSKKFGGRIENPGYIDEIGKIYHEQINNHLCIVRTKFHDVYGSFTTQSKENEINYISLNEISFEGFFRLCDLPLAEPLYYSALLDLPIEEKHKDMVKRAINHPLNLTSKSGFFNEFSEIIIRIDDFKNKLY